MDGAFPLVRCRWEGVHIMRQFGDGIGPGKVTADPSSVVGSDILAAGQRLIFGMRRTAGSGEPEQGHAFGGGALTFSDAEQAVASAHPGEHWLGGAARTYADANRRQADDIASMAVLDRGVQTVIAREANQIRHHRENLDGQANYLADLRRTTGSIAVMPGVGTALTAAFESAAVTTTLGACTGEIDQLTQEVAENVAALQQIAGEYSALAATSPEHVTVDEEVNPPPTEREQKPTPDAPSEASTAGTPIAESVAAPAPEADVAGPVAAAPDANTAPAMPAEAISGITSALGVVGGLIGAVVAPVTAALSGVAGAVGQSMSMLPSAAESPVAMAREQTPEGGTVPDTDGDEISREKDSDAVSTEVEPDDGAGPTAPSTESAEPPPASTDKLDPGHSPAATRPPR